MEGRTDDENEGPIDLSSHRRAVASGNAGRPRETEDKIKRDTRTNRLSHRVAADDDGREANKTPRKKIKHRETAERTSPPSPQPENGQNETEVKRGGAAGERGRRRRRDDPEAMDEGDEEEEEEEEEEEDKSTWPVISPIMVFMAHLAACTSSMPEEKMRVVMTSLETQLRFMFRAEPDSTDTGIVLATRLLPYIVDRVNSVQFANAGSLQLNYLTKRIADRNVAASLNLSTTNMAQRVRAYSSKMNVVADARINVSHNFHRLGGVRRVFETYNNFYTGSTVFTVRPRKSLREELLEPGAHRFFDPHAPPSSFYDADAPYFVRRQTLREGRGAPSTNVPIGGATGSGGVVMMDTSLVF